MERAGVVLVRRRRGTRREWAGKGENFGGERVGAREGGRGKEEVEVER